MTVRWAINGLLLALVLVLVSLIQRDLSRGRTPPTLSDLIASDLLLIEIAREGEPAIQLGQSLQGWRLEAPMEADADPERIDRLLAILDTPVHRSIPQASAALDQLGLASPRIRLRLNTLELAFGGIDPISQYRYVASEGLIHLIDDRFYPLLIAPPLDYVSRRLLPRGFVPVFGRLAGVPLAADALDGLVEVVAERIEPLTGEPSGSPVELKSEDGTALRFLVSEDRRRWSRSLPVSTLQQGPKDGAAPPSSLLYVLATAPVLTENPSAIDPTPPAPEVPPSDRVLESAPFSEQTQDESEDPFAPPSDLEESNFDEPDPNAILPGDVELGRPPEVRLTPDGQAPADVRRRSQLRGEPDKAAPIGFGEDPFAPDPEYGEE
ncbi:DUF4340 domain-containing protein [Thiocystis violascens]|uniref:DUF4340 domain-containing protein n=1 Tax=Thiocystis violascens (strain ATCC 17096 / DSM 198 / 6111) TaxID=765911 RepID=I3YAA6_THIV6|nr:DUF4340 domain-containing protein [Thiocystis violascens]AFL73924.1 hypothetical protein Thivi_1966 [Thiocystis violascens DSM 198]